MTPRLLSCMPILKAKNSNLQKCKALKIKRIQEKFHSEHINSSYIKYDSFISAHGELVKKKSVKH